MRHTTHNKGFSLLELMIAVSIMTALVAMLVTIFNTSMRVWSASDSKVEIRQNARALFDRLSTDISSISIDAANSINCIVMADAIYFVSRAIYRNGSTQLTGYQECGVFYPEPDGNDTDFTDDAVKYVSRHSLSGSSFAFEDSFTTLLGLDSQELAGYVVGFTVECWNHLDNSWLDWQNWPGAPSNPAWNVLNPVTSNDPDAFDYVSSDPSNKGIMPRKLRVTVNFVQPDTAEWINMLNSASFNSYVSGYSGSNRQKAIGKLTDQGLVAEYSFTIVLPET